MRQIDTKRVAESQGARRAGAHLPEESS